MKITPKITGDQAVRDMMRQIGEQGLSNALAATAEEVEAYVEGEAAKHNKSGRLVASISKMRTPGGWWIGHDPRVAPHAIFAHWGTKPHKIRPNKKKALRWPAGSMFAFAKEVNHPGYEGDPWMNRAAAQAPHIFAAQLARRLKEGD